MRLWKLTPVADAEDPRWQGRTIWSEVIVEAPSAAFARQFAADWELAGEVRRVGNESPSPKSGFEDEKLYWVRALPDAEARDLGLSGGSGAPVLRAIKPEVQPDEPATSRRPVLL